MTALHFSKYHGTGNDFILIDNRSGNVQLSQEEIAQLCHRRYGIGADGLMFLEGSRSYDFEMRYYNADGREGTMCGNGGRCISAFAFELGIVKDQGVFKAIDGVHRAVITPADGSAGTIEISLNDVVEIKKAGEGEYILDTGSPHFVKFTSRPEHIDVFSEGKRIRWDQRFQPGGINVNFVQKDSTGLHVRTFERGVEDVTLSCGTGVTACAIAAAAESPDGSYSWNIRTPGGSLTVMFKKETGRYTDIRLKGPAVKVFEGKRLR